MQLNYLYHRMNLDAKNSSVTIINQSQGSTALVTNRTPFTDHRFDNEKKKMKQVADFTMTNDTLGQRQILQ